MISAVAIRPKWATSAAPSAGRVCDGVAPAAVAASQPGLVRLGAADLVALAVGPDEREGRRWDRLLAGADLLEVGPERLGDGVRAEVHREPLAVDSRRPGLGDERVGVIDSLALAEERLAQTAQITARRVSSLLARSDDRLACRVA